MFRNRERELESLDKRWRDDVRSCGEDESAAIKYDRTRTTNGRSERGCLEDSAYSDDEIIGFVGDRVDGLAFVVITRWAESV